MEGMHSLFYNEISNNESQCFNYTGCYLPFIACGSNASEKNDVHPDHRYSDASAAWVLISAIIVFFMKAGFLLIELAFAQNVREKRHVITLKHLDVFASAFGFFLFGFDRISLYSSPIVNREFGRITDPILWFFKFTFASNAATILGGCLVTNKYKLRLPAAFMSAFVISGIIHPLIAMLIWSDEKQGVFSVYRFCDKDGPVCNRSSQDFMKRVYILDFAGGGAVHLVGGMAGFVLCLFAKFQNYWTNRQSTRSEDPEYTAMDPPLTPSTVSLRERPETISRKDFWEWMYPVDGGGENTNEAALGVLILWFSWFAFNCGSTENLESFFTPETFSYHAVPSIIAVNMILAASSGGIVAVIIAAWAQMRSRSDSVNANEIANGILSALVAITAGCPFYEYWGACVVGVIAVIVYHIGCWLEYKLGINDTARVVPVHGLCGMWSLLAVGLLVLRHEALCNLHITFEGLCYCYLRLPDLNIVERIGAQLIGVLIMMGITGIISFIMYGILFLLPMKVSMSSRNRFTEGYNLFMTRIFKLLFINHEEVNLKGNWLFTEPEEDSHIPAIPQGAVGNRRRTSGPSAETQQGQGNTATSDGTSNQPTRLRVSKPRRSSQDNYGATNHPPEQPSNSNNGLPPRSANSRENREIRERTPSRNAIYSGPAGIDGDEHDKLIKEDNNYVTARQHQY